MKKDSDFLKYFIHSEEDEKWGLVCTTVGYQEVEPNSPYPLSSHPSAYNFTRSGRILNEYLAVYITKGGGTFFCDKLGESRIEAGDIIFLKPGERHRYCPSPNIGWMEIWIGFKGRIMDKLSEDGLFKSSRIIHVGIKEDILAKYERILSLAKEDKMGVQQAIAGEIFSLLCTMHYESINIAGCNNKNAEKIERAKMMLKENLSGKISPSDVADKLGISYSLLRNQFKAITGISMSSYLINQRLTHAKTLLSSTGKSIQEIADETGFESLSRFCSSFRQHVGMTAGQFRERNSFGLSEM